MSRDYDEKNSEHAFIETDRNDNYILLLENDSILMLLMVYDDGN